MADVKVGSMPEALGLLLLRSSDEGQALTDLRTHITAIEAFLSGDFAAWSATQETTLREIHQLVAGGLPAGTDPTVAANILSRLDQLAAALAEPRAYTITPAVTR
ncbi:hypothetical protein [Candidatus Frankia alpina]|uniref:hypothetical protein n=1 Tax=Candidatus Frankia alpina TaxID=2699483 RepID=UPI001F42DFEF|nr:hypothetical protein [Candidatus Frankia alpina]